MPYHRPKRSFALPIMAVATVAAPLAVLALGDSADYRSANDSNLSAIPTQLAEVALGSAQDVVLPLRELTGLDLPDLRVSDLRTLPAAPQVPDSVPVPPGARLPGHVPLPQVGTGQTAPTQPTPGRASSALGLIAAHGGESAPTPQTPALSPGAVPVEIADQVGAQVKELNRDTPFSMVALTARDLADTTALVRARRPDGTWSPWYDAETADSLGSDRPGRPHVSGTEPIYVGNTNAVQFMVTRRQTALAAPPAEQPPQASAMEAASPTAAHSEGPVPTVADLTAVLLDSGRGAADENLSTVAAPLGGGGPKVITRVQWGADESIRCEGPTYDDQLGGVIVHHTAGRNDYSKEESAGIVRAIYAYHAQTLGWCDIGYNALVDQYGQIFEGRFGGLDRPVQGAHTGGFNENTSGVALMGNHESEPPTEAAIAAVGQFVGWRTKIAGLDPKGFTTMYSEGTEFTPYPQGEAVRLPIVFSHRDVGNTSCAGDAAYALMDHIRDIAAASTTARAGTTPAAPNSRTAPRAQTEPRTQTDLSALTALTAKLLGLVGDNAIAKHWADAGGPDGRLGAAASELLPTAGGGQYARFVNGYVYTSPDGQVYEVAGRILDRFLQLGGDTGLLGPPSSNAYAVPDGERAEFRYGSLIFNQVTGVVTTILKTYGDTDQAQPQSPTGAPAAGPVSAGTIAPAAE